MNALTSWWIRVRLVARVIACALALVLPDMATGGIAVVERLKPRIHFLLVAASEVSHRPSMPGTLADIKIIEVHCDCDRRPTQ